MKFRKKQLPELSKPDSNNENHAKNHGGSRRKFLLIFIKLIAKFIIRQDAQWKFWWDVLILAFAVAICFLLPFQIGFIPPWGTKDWWHVFEAIVETFFSLDVIIHFNTSVYDIDGNEVFDRKHIAIDYLMEMHFWIDMAATVPTGVTIQVLNILGCLVTNAEGDQNHQFVRNHQEAIR
jgi:hypothetical protein